MKREASLFDQLDATDDPTVVEDELAAYFRDAEDTDKLWTIALLSGRRPKRAVTYAQLRQWAMEVCGIPDWLFDDSHRVVGDFVETVTHLSPTERATDNSLTEWVRFANDLKNASADEKGRMVKAAWAGLEGLERLVFNRIISGGFRTAVSQKNMVKALAKATGLGEDALAHRLVGVWSPHTTTFQELLFSFNIADRAAHPFPFQRACALDGDEETGIAGLNRLISLGEPLDWQVEPMWDGLRAQLIVRGHRHFVWSGKEELVTDHYPELAQLREALPPGTVLDGEILAWKNGAPLAFSATQKRIGRKPAGLKVLSDVPVVFMSFDLLEFDGRDIRKLPLSERRSLLERVVADASNPALLITPTLRFASWPDVVDHHEQARITSMAGLMLKRRSSSYEAGRERGDRWKWKADPLTVDAVLTFSTQGHGPNAHLFTDHTFGLWDEGRLVTFAKASSGLSDVEMKEVDRFVKQNTLERFGPVRQVEPQLVFEIAFEGIHASTRHKSGVAVREARIVRWRPEKTPADANTIDDLKKLIAVHSIAACTTAFHASSRLKLSSGGSRSSQFQQR